MYIIMRALQELGRKVVYDDKYKEKDVEGCVWARDERTPACIEMNIKYPVT